jgi:glycosyltransferase involved in cell wall biosynthesis
MTTRISIVTPSFNQGRFLPQTLEGVRRHDDPALEQVGADGVSTVIRD